MGARPLPPELTALVACLAGPLHGRLAWRLPPLMTGALFAQGRRPVASWLRGAGLGHDAKAYYYFLGALGRKGELLAALLLRRIVARLAPRGRLLFALDDTPTRRYGKHGEGAGLHHNPTPGPADPQFVYGHVGVTRAGVVRHPLGGARALPRRGLLYVRQKGIALLGQLYGVRFETKLEMAARLIDWLADWLKYLARPLGLVADGAYARRPVLKRARARGVVVVSRLRKDAALGSVPEPARPQADLRQAGAEPGPAGGQPGWVADGEVHAVRQGGGQDAQDVPGDLQGGLRPDPGGAGEGGGALGGVLLHRPAGERGPGAGGVRRPGGARAGVQGFERGPRGGPAAGAQLRGERGGAPPGAVVAHAGGAVGVGPAAGPAERPHGLAVGRPGAAAFARGQAQGVAPGVPARGNPECSGAATPGAAISGGAAPAAHPRGLSVGFLRQGSGALEGLDALMQSPNAQVSFLAPRYIPSDRTSMHVQITGRQK
jgi:hypothetical protein